MLSKKNVVFIIGMLFIFTLFSFNGFKLNGQIPMKIEKKTPVLIPLAEIGLIEQDAEPKQVLQVNGQRFGDTQGLKKIYLGGTPGIVRAWYNNYIELEYPKSPILAKQFPVVIKNGSVVVSNVKKMILRARLLSCTPSSINRRPIGSAIVTLETMYTGTNKRNIKIRFKRKTVSLLRVKKLQLQYFGKIISIALGTHYNTIKVSLPESITPGLYNVDIMQDNRVAATLPEGPVTLMVK